jgi:cytochrome c biogenesis protein CcdA
MTTPNLLNALLSPAMAGANSLNPLGLLLAPVLGALTAFGPCSVTRMGTLTSLTAGTKRPLAPALTFLLGNTVTLVGVAFTITVIGALALQSRWLYLGIGLLAIFSGIRAIWTADDAPACAHEHGGARPMRTFALGATFGLLIQPCCMPIIFIAAGVAAVNPLYAIAMVVLFSIGHGLPPLLVAHTATRLSNIPLLRTVAPTVIGAIALACGLAYVAVA